MATNRSATTIAGPFSFLILKKFFHTMLFDKFQVLDHAHMVFGSVTLVNALQSLTGVLPAFIRAMFPIVFLPDIAVLDHTIFPVLGLIP